MAPARIVIVEDEFIVAADLRQRLQKLGYNVAGVATNGNEAIRTVRDARPDLLLLDIQLGEGIDGVSVARRVLEEQHLPIIFMTAYSDNETLQRAKLVGPYGYVLKPFEERELRTAVEMALHKHMTDLGLRESEKRLQVDHRGEGIVYLSPEGRFEYANAGAEEVFGVPDEGLAGRSLGEFMSTDGITRVLHDVDRQHRTAHTFRPIAIERRDGSRRELLVTTTAARDAQGAVTGFFVVFRDAARRAGPGRIFCTDGRMSPTIPVLDEEPEEGALCPLAEMRPVAEESLLQIQSALGEIVGAPLTGDQRCQLELLQRAVERLRLATEKALIHLHLRARFIRLSRELKPAPVVRD